MTQPEEQTDSSRVHPDSSEVGVETEQDSSIPTPDEIRRSFITASDWTTDTIVTQLRKGNIDLNPRFQRREAWTPRKKSLFIESIILNFPIPQIVLAERQDDPNTYIVLDGKQRLLAIRQFCANEADQNDGFATLNLSELSVRPDLEGLSYEALLSQPHNTDILNAFDNHTIRTVVIRNWSSDSYLHRVFLRLNTESVPLSPQELRQALLPGDFTDFVDEFATSSTALQSALGISGPDFRMRDNEIFLRHIAFAIRAEEYRGNLKSFLDDSTRLLNSRWGEDKLYILSAAQQCDDAILATQEIFGIPDSFKTYSDGSFQRRFNRAVFDIMTYYFRTETIRQQAVKNSTNVRDAFITRSTEDSEFLQSLTTTTKSKRFTAMRFVTWAEELSKATDTLVSPPIAFKQSLEH